jgi:preprotein translocase subunit SecG
MVLTTGSVLVTLLSIAFVFVCFLLILLILIQRPKGGGLAGAFGGAGGSDQAMFGAKAGDALTWITVGLFVGFLLLAMGLTWATDPTGTTKDVPVIEMPVDGQTDDAAAATDEAKTQAADDAATMGDKVDAAVQTVKETASDTAEAVKEGTAKAVEVTGEAVDKAVEATKDAVETVKTQIKEATTDSEAK